MTTYRWLNLYTNTVATILFCVKRTNNAFRLEWKKHRMSKLLCFSKETDFTRWFPFGRWSIFSLNTDPLAVKAEQLLNNRKTVQNRYLIMHGWKCSWILHCCNQKYSLRCKRHCKMLVVRILHWFSSLQEQNEWKQAKTTYMFYLLK